MSALSIDAAARRRLEAPLWQSALIMEKKDNATPRAVLANCVTILRQHPKCSGVFGYNSFSQNVVTRKETPWGTPAGTQWTDNQDRHLTELFQRLGVMVGVEISAQAVQLVAEEHAFHPVRDMLDGLATTWDGKVRLPYWLRDYLGVSDSDYSRAVSERWLISAVARIYKPGCKADCAIVLEGKQGAKKSTALRILTEPFFADELADFGSKDAALQTAGVWVIEISELDGMNRADVGRIKAFMSRSTDRFRPPYGRRIIESPRQCVFAGTCNGNAYLRDETGARRFWPVEVGVIDIDGLRRDKAQIWAEAVLAFRQGRPWWLDTSFLEKAAAEEQADRYEGDPWECAIEQWASERPEITVDQVLRLCIGKTADKMPQSDQNRVSRCLRSLGWVRFNARNGSSREWRYRRQSD